MAYKFKVTCKKKIGDINVGDSAIVESNSMNTPSPNDIKKGFNSNASIGSASVWFDWERIK